jgi:CDP-glucose 4,6-dehydratase
VCDRHQVDTIFHLAASAIVSDAANSPVSTIENNVVGTLNILEVARINKIPRVLIVSSDKSYGDHAAQDDVEPIPYHESYALRGLDVYSTSKVCADMLAQTYSYQFKVPALVVRSCNIYGPGDLNYTRLVPKTIMCLLAKMHPVINRGNENVLREYIYVDDVVKAYVFLMEHVKDYYGENNCNMPRSGKETYGWAAFNVGTYTEEDIKNISACEKIKSVKDVISLLRSKITDIEPVVVEKPSNFIEIPDQYTDCSKLFKLGFRPSVSFDEGLIRSIDWYKSKYDILKKNAFKYINEATR